MRRLRHLRARYFGPTKIVFDASLAGTMYDDISGGSPVANNAGIARWEDQSGFSLHATQGTGTDRPLRIDRAVGGLTAARFDGTDSLSVGACDALANVTSACIAFIGKRDSTGTGDRFWFFVSHGANGSSTRFDFNSSGDNCSAEGRRLDSDSAAAFTSVSDGGDNKTAVSVVNIDYVSGDATWLRNGAVIGTKSPWGTAGGATSNTNALQVRVGGYTQSLFLYKGDICEIVLWHSKLSEYALRLFNDSRRAKWRIGTVTV